MAWDSAAATFGGKPLRLQPPCKMADALNQASFKDGWIDKTSVRINNGRVADGVLDRIDEDAKAHLMKSKLTAGLRKSSHPTDLVFHALLKKDIEFEKPFAKLGTWKVGGRPVKWFGFTPEMKGTASLLEQVKVHHYGSVNDFVIELASKQNGDQLLLAKVAQPPASLATLKQSIVAKVTSKPESSRPADLLAVPNLVAEESASFAEFRGKTLAGGSSFIREAMQTIDFRMDEKGVKLRSEASLTIGCSANVRVKPRLLVLDPPFAVVMKRKNAPEPYFVAWIGNADLLSGD